MFAPSNPKQTLDKSNPLTVVTRAALQRVVTPDQTVQTTGFAHSLAVVVGIDAYTGGIPPLYTAVSDARTVARVLERNHHYKVYLLDQDVTKARIGDLLTQVLPNEVEVNDRLLFYFAGHGVALDGDEGPQGYLVPQNAQLGKSSSFLPMHELHQALTALPCRHLLAILDCCFAGAFRWSSTRALSSIPDVIHKERYERFILDPAWQVITSADYDQKALDILSGDFFGTRGSDEQHSPFAKALVAALEAGAADLSPVAHDHQPAGDGIITATELYLYLRDCVEVKTQDVARRQTPGIWPLKRHDKGEYVFFTPGRSLELPDAPDLTDANNPYRGLEPFDEAHQAFFFGRTEVADALHHDYLANQLLTIVVGASGTGKSSLVKAGLLPRLRADLAQAWHILPILRPGTTPLTTLKELINSAFVATPDHVDSALTNTTLITNPSCLLDTISTWAKANPTQRLLLVIDQFEELITLCHNETECGHFIQQLAELLAAQLPQVRIVLTLRSDFEPHFQHSALEPYWKHDARFVIPAMSQDELREVIEGPASMRVLYFEPYDLIDQLINEVVQMPGALPLLSFTLSELYHKYLARHGKNRALTQADYDELGGVVGCLSKRATYEYELLSPSSQTTMRKIVLRMIAAEGTEFARRRVLLSELHFAEPAENERVEQVIQQLVAVRLLVVGGEGEDAFVEPAHDALIRAWETLKIWRREAEKKMPLQIQRRLTQAAAEWDKSPDSASKQGLLWVEDPRLPQFQYILQNEQDAEELEVHSARQTLGKLREQVWPPLRVTLRTAWLNQAESRFLTESISQKAKNTRRLISYVTLVLLVLAVLLGVALLQWQATVLQRNQALSNESRRLASLAEQQLTVDPVASIHLSMMALPNSPESVPAQRPYVPQAEFALTQALQANLESSYLATRAAMGDTTGALAWLEDRWLASVEGAYDLRLWLDSQPLPTLTFERPIDCIAWRPHHDGDIAVCSGGDVWFDVWLWSQPTQKRQQLFLRENALEGLTWSSDGRYLAAWQMEAFVLWDDSRQETVCRQDLSAGVYQVHWSPSATQLLVLPFEVAAAPQIVDTTCQLIQQLPTPADTTDEFRGFAGATWLDTERLLLWDLNGTTHLSSVEGENLQTFTIGGDVTAVNNVSLAPDGQSFLALMDNGDAHLWQLGSREPMATLQHDVEGSQGHQIGIVVAAWRDESYVATGDKNGSIFLWDLATATPNAVLYGHTEEILGLAWRAKGLLASYSQDGSQRTWSLFAEDGQPRCAGVQPNRLSACRTLNSFSLDHDQPIDEARWLDNQTILTTDATGSARWIDHLMGNVLQLPGQVGHALWSPDGMFVLTYPINERKDGQVWSFDGGVWKPTYSIAGPVTRAFWIETGLLVSAPKQPLRLMDPASGGIIELLSIDGEIWDAALQNERLAIVDERRTIHVWELSSRQPLTLSVTEPTELFRRVHWDHKGQRLLAVTAGGMLYGWIVNTGAPLWPSFVGDGEGEAVAFSPDERLIAFGAQRKLYVLDAASGVLLASKTQNDLHGVQWQTSRDGLQLLTWGGEAAQVWRWHQAWDEVAPDLYLILQVGDGQRISHAAFNPEGSKILTGGRKGQLRIWQAWQTTDALIESAQSATAIRPLSNAQRERFLLQ